MATTMNPIDQYRDPALSNAGLQSDKPYRNGSGSLKTRERQRKLTQDGMVQQSRQIQPEADVSVGPPISYRGIDPNADPRSHRSFSQRAKSRPFADEAFADDNFDDYSTSRTSAVSGQSAFTQPNESPLQQHPVTMADQLIQRPTDPALQSSRSSNTQSQGRTRPNTSNRMQGMKTSYSVSRPTTVTDAGNQTDEQRRNWAPDRSPLQKLEVKLTDIHKEEKRAKVQEAEMRLRQAQATRDRNTLQTSANLAPRSAPQPVRIVSEPVRTAAGSADRPMPFQSTVNKRSISSGRAKKAPLTGPVADIPARQHDVAGRPNLEIVQRPHVEVHRQRAPRTPPSSRNDPSRPVAQTPYETQVAPSVNSQIPRPSQQRQSRQTAYTRPSDRPLSERERNASHQAALQQLTGEQTPLNNSGVPSEMSTEGQKTVQSRAKGRKPVIEQNGPVVVDLGTLGGDISGSAYTAPQSIAREQVQSPQSQRTRNAIGLGLSSPPPAKAATSNSLDNIDPNQNRQRKSSVSFKEPFDRRRPVDEWKSAETATLTVGEFSTEEVKGQEPYKAWWERDQTRKASRARATSTHGTSIPSPIDDRTATFNPSLHLKCGPLLRYAGLRRARDPSAPNNTTREFWRGSIMIVTQDSLCSYEEVPTLRIFSQPKRLLPPPPAMVTGEELAPEYIDPIAGLTRLSRTGRALYVRPVDHLEEATDLSRIEDDNGIYEASPSPLDVNGSKDATAAITNRRTLDMDGERLGRFKEVKATRLYADPDRDVTFWRFNIEIELGNEQQHVAYRINKGASVGFWVPARGQTMNIMFHSCNGFSVSVDPNTFSGPDPLWRDVLNNHQTRPFHVMIGGGDQIYNDRVMMDTQHFGEWTKIRNPHHKHQAPFTPEMKEELETYYLERYSMWFSQGLFGMANASIPMVNIWDDHDIIDGFGSYPDDFMKTPVFTGLGEIAHKYYLLFQHQTVDMMTEKDEPSWILGKRPGPYIPRVSRSLYLELGQKVAFLGVDGRTERTRHDVISDDTLEAILERCRRDMIEGQTKHLIVLLGVPIAYPRLVWLENVLTSKALDPIKALHRAGIVKTKLLNRFDGGVEILDDLDDHWTATHHKEERTIFIQDLQDLAAEKSARVTILGGDVHLAAIGQFYSNPKLKIPKDKDHRYMPNVISSAIVNTPPPDMLADVLNKRNKVHHLDMHTDENMIPMFTHDVDDKKRNNTRLLPRRNWCSIREYLPGDTPPPTPPLSPSIDEHSEISENEGQLHAPKRRLSLTKNGFNPRNLMRRFSSRGAPPNSYRANTDSDQFQQRATSLDGIDRPATVSHQVHQQRASSADHIPDVPTLRPSYQRRPTNLSEKAARKGIVPDVDADGNEVHFNDHVNLEGGLDIVLNCEVNQKDPTGITTQYRLLVPALWYDGSSDIEKLNGAKHLSRRDTLLKKFGLNPRSGNQSAGNEEPDMSETESYTESEGEHPEPPKKKFSLFSSLRRKQNRHSDVEHENSPHIDDVQNPQRGQIVPVVNNSNGSTTYNTTMQPHAFDTSSNPNTGREIRTLPRTSQIDDHSTTPSSQPPLYQKEEPAQTQRHQPPVSPPVQQSSRQPSKQSYHQPSPYTQPSNNNEVSSPRTSYRNSRPLSYTIGSATSEAPRTSTYSGSSADGHLPYDPDAAYVSSQQRSTNTSTGYSNPGRSTEFAQQAESAYSQPGQRQLRGNGIIGKNVAPPSSFRNSNDHNVGIHESDSSNQPKGYSGIEAYKETKPTRRWSLREKARNMMGNLDSRRKQRNDDDDEWYSDEEEAAHWEGPKRY